MVERIPATKHLLSLALLFLVAAPPAFAERSHVFVSRTKPGTVGTEMLGGTFSPTLTQGPFALIEVSNDSEGIQCSGILVGPREVITAAHCIAAAAGETKFVAADYSVTVGGAEYGVSSATYNSKYDPNADVDDASSANDLGMLVLRSAVTGTSPLPIAKGSPVTIGETATMYGFGTNATYDENDASYENDLADGQYGTIVVSRVANGVFDSEYLNNTAVSCEGDSGGAIVRGSGASASVIGLVSSGTTQNTRSGACVGQVGDEADTYVDLQNSSSRTFLAKFPEVIYSDGSGGGGDSLASTVRPLVSLTRAALQIRSLSSLKSRARTIASRLATASPWVDVAHLSTFNDAKRALNGVRSARGTSAAAKLLRRALADLQALTR